MRIGIYDPYLDDLGGGEKYMMTVAQCLSEKHDVSVFWDDKKDIDNLLERFTLDLSRISLHKNIFSNKVGFFERIFQTRKFDAIIVLSDGSIPFCLSRKLFLHIQAPMQNLPNNFKTKIKTLRVTNFFCNSNYTKDYIDRSFNVASALLYPPVSVPSIKKEKENIILHVGRFRVKNVHGLDDYKKQSVMVEVFKEMVSDGLKDWRFILAVSVRDQDKELFEKLREKTKALPIEFIVNCSNEKLFEIYSRAKIYWHASGFGENLEKHPEYAEHFGISTVEAMGSGAVPVVINAGGQKEIVQENVNGLLWNDIDEFKNKTNLLINDKVLLETLSKNAVKRAEFFSGEKFCDRVLALVEK